MNVSGISVLLISFLEPLRRRGMAGHVTGMEVHRQEGTKGKAMDVLVVQLLRLTVTTDQEARKYVANLHQGGS
jgi:hypothetical protein